MKKVNNGKISSRDGWQSNVDIRSMTVRARAETTECAGIAGVESFEECAPEPVEDFSYSIEGGRKV